LVKTFDCVNQEILLAKLHFYGIQGVIGDWFRSYLTNRRQKVEIKTPNSSKILSLIEKWHPTNIHSWSLVVHNLHK